MSHAVSYHVIKTRTDDSPYQALELQPRLVKVLLESGAKIGFLTDGERKTLTKHLASAEHGISEEVLANCIDLKCSMCAANLSKFEFLETRLKQFEATIDWKDSDGNTLVMLLLKRGNNTSEVRSIVQLLHDKKADFSYTDKEDNTLLMMAVNYSIQQSDRVTTQSMVEQLLRYPKIQESLRLINKNGKTALKIAEDHGQTKVVKILKEAKKQPSVQQPAGHALNWGIGGIFI